MEMTHDIRIVVGIDFGVKHSTFAYAYKSTPSKIFVYNRWGFIGQFKTPTVLKYDESFNLISWGYSALSALSEKPNRKKQKPNRRKKSFETVENFLLHLSNMEHKPHLPEGLTYKHAIIDYLIKMVELIKHTTLMSCYPCIDFFGNVLIIMPIPAEYDDNAKAIMRECAYKACLINEENSMGLQFITKPTFIDCGSDTIELATQKLFKNHNLGEITKRNGDYCGGNFVDDKFVKFLSRKVGPSAIDLVRKNHYSQLQYMIQEFSRRVKFSFTGQQEDFMPFELDLYELCPVIRQYIKDSELDKMEVNEWCIELNFDDVKAMFDPVIERILQLIRTQLNAISSCEAMILVGNINIIVPARPLTVIAEGAVQYGLMLDKLDELDKTTTISPRVFEKTYGIKITRKWNSSDPIELKLSDGMINSFLRIAKCGNEIPSDTGISMIFSSSFISRNSLDLFVTDEHNVKYCDSPGVDLIGTLKFHIPSTFNNNAISITLFFDDTTIKVVAQEVDVKTGWKYEIVFDNIY
ncbi:unnamed protein product [Rhizophagus irregularis]|nr:unnamed protein product [Rhizophagus irregularis]